MGFSDFHGNAETVAAIRQMLARDRFPHAVILAGPRGSGKFTLAQMIAKAMNCLEQPAGALPDFCGHCANCVQIGGADDLPARLAEAVEARENLREADRKDTRIFVQTHADVLIIPPDPPQMMVKVDQIRHLISAIYKRPAKARQAVYIFPESAFMKEAANSLLKVLEEPPAFATLLIASTNPGELLPTIRSRCVTLRLAPLPTSELEQYLAQGRPDWNSKTRALVARLCGGAVGKAICFDLETYTAARKDALVLLNSAVHAEDHSQLFRTTEDYRAGGEGREKTEQLLQAVYGVLEDILYLKSGASALVRNVDIVPELSGLAGLVDFQWIVSASHGLDEVHSGMRRNVLRSLSLDAFSTELEPETA
ncbi:MAG TPA: DNA polymerase III subunit delta' [Terriglobales bacterium]|nr:DNA polymerase III subunit delta' [Terriglobales bacterium]